MKQGKQSVPDFGASFSFRSDFQAAVSNEHVNMAAAQRLFFFCPRPATYPVYALVFFVFRITLYTILQKIA